MSNLDEQLKYFINIKLTTDPLWKDVTVHLSGHLVDLFFFVCKIWKICFVWLDTRWRWT